MNDKKIRVSEEIYEQLAKLAEKGGRSIRELAEEAIKAYLLGTENVDKPVKAVSGKIIPIQYETKCKFCGKTINKGELAYWVKYTFDDNSSRSYVICLDCYYKDTALAEWYLKKKKLEGIVRGLKNKADQLAEEVEKLQVEYDVLKVKQEVLDLWRNFESLFLSTEQSLTTEKMEEFMDRLNELLDRVGSLEATLNAIPEFKKYMVRRSVQTSKYESKRAWM
ncbi:MAG: hypothetical protein CBR30_09770 [Dictyoglomus sp. NZ13-RE01]|nr:MAG: hypothetical protein CBR30_09770 [Dictyoglomus sp. NZ13-RE01]